MKAADVLLTTTGAAVGLQPKSDGVDYDFDFDSFSGYTDLDSGSTAASTLSGGFLMETGGGSPPNSANRNNNSAFAASGLPTVISIIFNVNDKINTLANNAGLQHIISINTSRDLNVVYYSDVIGIRDYGNVWRYYSYTPIIDQDGLYDFVIDKSGTPWLADVFQNGVEILSGKSVGRPGAQPGRVNVIANNSYNTDELVATYKKLLIGDPI